jgi:putative transposase
MAQTFASLLTHVIFSTKNREPLIAREFQAELWAYLGGIVRNLDGKALVINGTADHVHLLVSLPPTVSVADAVRVIKANSSKWLHQKRHASFAWQNGYGAFSVSSSAAPEVIEYIRRQEEHHRRMTFQEELVGFLKKHQVEYDKRYIWA